MNSKNIGIIGGTLWGNRGAEAMLVTAIAKLKEQYPHSKIKVFSYYPEQDRLLCTDPQVEILNYKPIYLATLIIPFAFFKLKIIKEVQALNSCFKIYDIAGISFSDEREIFLLYNVASLLPALLLKKPIVKLAQALGPFKGFLNRKVSKKYLTLCEHIYARGEDTLKNFKELQTPIEKYSLSSDLGFLYQDSYSISQENYELLNKLCSKLKSIKRIVTIMPSSLLDSSNKGYSQKIVRLTHFLLENNYHILFIPNATRETSDQPRNNDIYVIRKIKNILKENDNITYIDYDINTSGIRKLLNFTQAVITSRFHGMIASLALTKPTLVIGWGHKYEEIFKLFSIQEYSFSVNDKEEEILFALENMLKDSDSIKKMILSRLHLAKELAEKQFQIS